MNFQQDWVMRQIENIVRFLASVLFHKDTLKYEIKDELNLTETDMLYNDIKELIEKREICKAEDLLYEKIDANNKKDMELAIDFYQTINLFSDEELERCNFSRDEINDGLKNITKIFGIDNFLL